MLQVEHITKKYVTGELTQMALDDVSLSFRDSEFVAILGPSGSGKTTLLNVIGGLDRYDSGDLIINGVSTKKYKDKDWDAYRNHTIGFIFQSYNLIPHQNVLSNVELSLTLSNIPRAERRQRAIEALEKVGLGDQIHKKPNQLSGGQMQRVAIARALVNNPDIILADEPTGALDTVTSVQVMDLLKEVAEDKLVIMVTHNPELAQEYATRIVNLRDGHITSDTDPVAMQEIVSTDAKMKHTKLSFFTALSLSLNNLLTKKGRTFLTSFAGSIGIIGIAAILALSNGVNEYIARQEQDMLGSYPITLEKEAIDLESMMERRDSRLNENKTKQQADYDSETVYSNNIVADTVKTEEDMIKQNDLGKFKRYLDVNHAKIKDDYVAIEYNYAITPYVYRYDSSEGIINVSPSTLSSSTGESTAGISSSAMSGFAISNYITSTWTQLVDNKELRSQQYTLLEGHWPEKADEVAIVVTEKHEISDYTLYTLGFMDIGKMKSLIDDVKDGKSVNDPSVEFDLSDFIGRRYKVFAPCQLYKKSGDAYVDKSDDDDFIKSHFKNAYNVQITCVLESKDNSQISSGVGYTSALTHRLLKTTRESDIVKKQLKNKKINIFTGKKFSDSKKKKKLSLSLRNSIEGFKEEEVLKYDSLYDRRLAFRAIHFNETEGITEESSSQEESSSTQSESSSKETESSSTQSESSSTQTSQSSTSSSSSTSESSTSETPVTDGYRVRFLNYDGSVLSSAEGYAAGDRITNLPQNDPTRSPTDTMRYMFIGWASSTDGSFYRTRQLPEVTESVDYTAMYYGYSTSLVDSLPEGTSLEEIEAYINRYLDQIGSGGKIDTSALEKLIQEYMKSQTGDLIDEATVQKYLEEYIKKNPQLMENMMKKYMEAYLKKYSNMSEKMIQQYLQKYLKKYQEMLMKKLKGKMNLSLTEDQLAVLLASMSSSVPTNANEVLTKLGYYTLDEPSSISIYPISFDCKDHIKAFISDYNKQVKKDTDKVTYSDVIGLLTQSITNIIDMITYVLIAFVAISLVVSSIMIAIITYISVLERTKEIGVLRALGASKNDISKIFNAETFIEGLISGIIGIAVTLVGCVIANRIIEKTLDVVHLARLPIRYAMILILISVVLTLIAGFLPSRIAAKKDPVTALRSE